MSDYIKREDVLRCLKEASEQIDWGQSGDGDAFKHYIGAVYRTIASSDCVPSADVVERKRGEWKEKEVVDYEETTITQWQSACCSVCGKYHTTAYLYYFDDFNFCPNCGADMRGESNE